MRSKNKILALNLISDRLIASAEALQNYQLDRFYDNLLKFNLFNWIETKKNVIIKGVAAKRNYRSSRAAIATFSG